MDKKKTKPFIEYTNIIGTGAFVALTLVQSVFAIIWLSLNTFAGEEGSKTLFRYKGLGSLVIMALVLFLLAHTMIKNVMGCNIKAIYYIVFVVYMISLPITISVNFDATLFAVCLSLLFLLLTFALRYFYGEHERRLFHLIGIFVILIVLSYLNRAAFWTGVSEAFLFLTIQLIRNIGIRRKNISDKSWRNTLLLFCILIIIMLIPQYCTYNNIKHTLYHQSIEEQLSARILVPYMDYEMNESNNEYLLGVIRRADYAKGHSYRDFKRIIHRYEEDGLDMDTIWKNLYTNVYYRYKKTIAKRYAKDLLNGYAAPFLIKDEMHSEEIVTHHGFYYGQFERNTPILSDTYMRFALTGLFAVIAVFVVQGASVVIIDLVKGKYKVRLEEGSHKIIEAIVLVAFLSLVCTALQTLFGLEGTSYVVSFGSTLSWIVFSLFIFFRNKREV